MSTLILFNKPYGVLSQFTNDKQGDKDKPTLAQYIKLPNVYPAGRLDHDSEGLLLLTDDGQLQHHIAHPAHKLPKTYWVQVEGAPNSYALTKLRQGVELNDGMTQPAEARLIPTPKLWERDPPIRSRQNIPTQWLEIIISEGKNRQVRRMTAAVGHPTLRLVRVKIGSWSLEGIAPGEYKATTVNLPKSALAETPRGRGSRPTRNASGKPDQKSPRNNTSGNTTGNATNKPRNKPSQPRTGAGINANKPSAAKPTMATKVIIKPSRPKPLSE
jgi:23S rRNA pseudouridine2457 synthase